MGLRDVNFEVEYRSLNDDVVNSFIVPALRESISYQRSVGYFSSSALLEITKGLGPFVANGGKMQLVASPHLSEEDIEAIDSGYKQRESAVKERILAELPSVLSGSDSERLNLLANMIADGVLDIKIAFALKNDSLGLYHEKLGIFEDKEGYGVAFSGSMNESESAMIKNYEAIDVYMSWSDAEGRFKRKKEAFNKIWNDSDPSVRTYDFPELGTEIVKRYKRGKPNYHIDKLPSKANSDLPIAQNCSGNPRIPEGLDFRKYQTEAIDSFENQGYRGLFDMATGTGKTKTGLGALVRASEHCGNKMAAIIVCPYQHLVTQWVEDIEEFGIKPIIGFSKSPQRDWHERLVQAVRDQRYGVEGADFFCFVCTNGTFALDRVQRQLSKIRSTKLIMVDEAHNFGADYLRTLLDESFDYRIALSATIDRHGDPEGTQYLLDYFGGRCITYSLDEAILGRGDEPPRLCQYKYYPVIVVLDSEELDEYKQISKEMASCLISKNGKLVLSQYGQILALKRARLVARASGKIPALKKAIQSYVKDNYILVYCGATSMVNTERDIEDSDDDDIRQIDLVTKMLGGELDMKVHQFTARESSEDRENLKERFGNGRDLQALIAIKCLDEGIDIPNIKTAFILASTTNPREYIQRRGRLLRPAPGKKYAEIYDFITLPRNPEETLSLTPNEMAGEKSLVYNELIRAKEFARLAINAARASVVLGDIEDAFFGINGIEHYRDEGVEEW